MTTVTKWSTLIIFLGMDWFSAVCVVISDILPWWCNQIESFSVLLAPCAGKSPVTGEFPSQRPVTRSFGVFFVLRLWWTSAGPLTMCRMGSSSQSSTYTEYEAKTSSGSRTSSETALNQWLSRDPPRTTFQSPRGYLKVLLFLLFINDIGMNISSNIRLLANDTIIYGAVDGPRGAERLSVYFCSCLLCCYKPSCLSNGAPVTKLEWSLYANHWLSCKSLAFEVSSCIALMLLNE